ncbi:fucose isomerase [Kaistia dalseonensis]|uniref:L-fucose isomerase-like protein n=1 Tax=Kaistia dalseonensis TaxID=410840 RepID=A0ABU0HDQ3_9HYPH|nr:fucose isomerase [Kaistia dalseonensis]MCX5497804.1 fucose isomerase [Kaistia dalseonensis]MDQ0440448.1 L-fucose isomerase-like protein [Kaistia dalseonensis]
MGSRFRAKVTLGLVIGSRAFFNGAPCKAARDELTAQLDALGIDYCIPPFEATVNGAVQSREDARLYAEFFREKRDVLDGLVICLPNFGDEIAVAELVNMTRLNLPILLQASNDETDKVDVKSRRDAFCGKLSVTNNFYQYDVAFTDTTSHTSDVWGEEFRGDLDRFARTCRTVRGLRNARIGAIGARTGAFQTMRFSEKLLQSSGITVVTVDLSEIMGSARAIGDDAPDVKAKLDDIFAYGTIPGHIDRANIMKQAKWSIAVDRWIDENECDASSIQCWRSLQDNYGCATCLTMSMLSEKLMPSACEVDVMGAISMYALALASGAPPAILDWNNNYGYEADKCVCTHCGNFPKSFIGDRPEISELDVLGETIGREKCFGAVKGKVRAGPMTFFRVSTDDRRGTIKAYVGEGAFTDDPFPMDGGIAVTEVPRLRDLMGFVARNGFEHHVAMVRGEHAAIVTEAIDRYLGWPIYRHEAAPRFSGAQPFFR